MQEVIWRPQPKQALAMSCPATELFFGGAAGGGKSDYLLGDYLEGARKYGKHWRGIIFRQSYPQLEELQIRAMELFIPLGAHYRDKSATWYFPNGATLKFRHLENDKACNNYQGHQYTWIGIDELGNYPTDYVWTFMLSRLRSAYGVPCYIRGTANPGGVGHGWLKHRFIDNAVPNQIRKIEVVDPSTGEVYYQTRVFVPSKLTDNQILMKNDPGYKTSLLTLPEHMRRALLEGDWSVFSGQIFSEFSVDTHVRKPQELIPGAWFKFCAMDWGYTRPFSIGWYAVNSQGRMIRYKEFYGCVEGEMNVGLKMGAGEVARRAWEMSITEGIVDMVADPAIWQKDSENPAIVDYFEEAGFKMHKANNERINGLVIMHERMTTKDHDGVPMFTVWPNCYAFIRTIPMLVPSPTHPEDVDTRLEDHVYDEARYACMSDFAKFPSRALQRQNGSWREQKPQDDGYDPLSMM